MCSEAKVGRKAVHTQRDLAKALDMRLSDLVMCDGYDMTARRGPVCLCPVDFAATAAKRGLRVIAWDEGFPGDVEFVGAEGDG